MSLDSAKAFLQRTDEDQELREKLIAAEGDTATILQLGAEAGFSFSEDELGEAMDELYGDLSDDDLSDVTGGKGGLRRRLRFR